MLTFANVSGNTNVITSGYVCLDVILGAGKAVDDNFWEFSIVILSQNLHDGVMCIPVMYK